MAIHGCDAAVQMQTFIRKGSGFAELGDAVREPRNFPLRRVAVNDVLLRCANDHRLGFGHGRERARLVAGSNRFLDLAHCAPQTRTPRPIDGGSPCALPCSLLGRFCIGHDLLNTN